MKTIKNSLLILLLLNFHLQNILCGKKYQTICSKPCSFLCRVFLLSVTTAYIFYPTVKIFLKKRRMILFGEIFWHTFEACINNSVRLTPPNPQNWIGRRVEFYFIWKFLKGSLQRCMKNIIWMFSPILVVKAANIRQTMYNIIRYRYFQSPRRKNIRIDRLKWKILCKKWMSHFWWDCRLSYFFQYVYEIENKITMYLWELNFHISLSKWWKFQIW